MKQNKHIIKGDKSTTRIARATICCGYHQTIAGALLKSKEWNSWYKYASDNMLYDVDETMTINAMSDKHWLAFVDFIIYNSLYKKRKTISGNNNKKISLAKRL